MGWNWRGLRRFARPEKSENRSTREARFICELPKQQSEDEIKIDSETDTRAPCAGPLQDGNVLSLDALDARRNLNPSGTGQPKLTNGAFDITRTFGPNHSDLSIFLFSPRKTQAKIIPTLRPRSPSHEARDLSWRPLNREAYHQSRA